MRRGNLSRAARDERGFTVVESLVAGLILLIGLIATVGVFDDSRDQNATAERHEIALMQAEQALEEMRGLPYKNLMLDAGAVEPPGANRLSGANGTERFRVKPGLDERLVYDTDPTKGPDPWVSPVSTVTVGPQHDPLELTIYRFITWRDEECRIANLDQLGLGNITSSVNLLQGPLTGLTNLLNSLLNSLLAILNPSNNAALNAVKARLQQVNQRLTQLPGALSGLLQLDLCDIDLSLVREIQRLGSLTGQFSLLADAIDGLRNTLNNLLGSLCLPIIGCLLGGNGQQNTVAAAINSVNTRLDCLFSNSSPGYLDGVLNGVDKLLSDLYNTDENSKRITVAVVPERRAGVGPFKPIWMSSVVRDPSAGLLSSGGAGCLD